MYAVSLFVVFFSSSSARTGKLSRFIVIVIVSSPLSRSKYCSKASPAELTTCLGSSPRVDKVGFDVLEEAVAALRRAIQRVFRLGGVAGARVLELDQPVRRAALVRVGVDPADDRRAVLVVAA